MQNKQHPFDKFTVEQVKAACILMEQRCEMSENNALMHALNWLSGKLTLEEMEAFNAELDAIN